MIQIEGENILSVDKLMSTKVSYNVFVFLCLRMLIFLLFLLALET